ncbi:response regulator transcription factor [Nocardia terpenica]|uniref:LuxR C-terminal-related transcriptional regulator n=1 Tax=Nocardia terpenica TaxID=455432 RepID=UPI001893DCA7|nr:LuxR C-terminal-related transcriptional regulator [Nocardia terpenica]MBF6063443.1 response regulator transcription factor [Nocardia terpenica]MBF6105999.1 response regulator transcription factor [Nocardia terpenica]MBF6113416.1 response regulator transcription factor [Nocardia terpenica]MBF6119740.1 response regulator transcription factor [Nocardia terpenica]MBF6152151.1 response regulator transcription factor [Nocardia terpenica]
MSTADLLRPRDSDALRAELRQVAAASGMPVVFGGQVHAGTLVLNQFLGTRTNAMRGLVVPPNSGLGGAAVAAGRPASVSDYRLDSTITHDYDAPVLSEGLRAVVAVPVLVRGESRAVLYVADRDAGPVGDRAADLVVQAGRRLAVELAIRDEVDRRVRLRETATAPAAVPDAVLTEELRDIHAEVRAIAQTVTDARARLRLRDLSDRLARLMSGPTTSDEAPALAPRELDVLAHIALGCTNAEAAQRLSLRPETVKSYLRSAMTKLGAHTRHETVVRARRLGLLP